MTLVSLDSIESLNIVSSIGKEVLETLMIILKRCMHFRIEQFAGEEQVTSHLDILLGDQWDIRKIGNYWKKVNTINLKFSFNHVFLNMFNS